MKSTLLLGIVLLASNAFAKAKVDYDYCSASTDKLFQLAKIPGKTLPNIFEISEDGILKANEKHAKLIMYNDETNKQTYKFRSSTEKKSFLKMFSKNNLDESGLNYKFEVLKDEAGRVKSIERVIDSESCPNCLKATQKISFTYTKNTCVPEQVFSNDEVSGTAIVADVVACKSIIEQQKDFFKDLRKGTKCINNLVSMYEKAKKTSSEQAQRLNKEGESYSDYIQSIFVGNLKEMAETAESLAKPLAKYTEEEDKQFNFQTRLSSLISLCTDNFDEKMLNRNNVFNKDYSIKKESNIRLMPEENPAKAVEAN